MTVVRIGYLALGLAVSVNLLAAVRRGDRIAVSAIIGISLFAFGRTIGKRFLAAIRGLNRSPVAAVVGIGFLADASAGSGIISFTAVRS